MLPHHPHRLPKPFHRSVARALRLNASRRKRGYRDETDQLAADIAEAVFPALVGTVLSQALRHGARVDLAEERARNVQALRRDTDGEA